MLTFLFILPLLLHQREKYVLLAPLLLHQREKYTLLAPTKNEIWMISSYCFIAEIFSSDLSIYILKIMYSNRQRVRKKFNVYYNDTN